jgi:hypothetical protein
VFPIYLSQLKSDNWTLVPLPVMDTWRNGWMHPHDFVTMVHPGRGTELAPSGWYTETIHPARRRLFMYLHTLNLRGDVQWCTPPGAITLMTGAAALAIDEHRLARSRRRRSTLGSPPALNVFFGSVFCQFFCGMGLWLLTFSLYQGRVGNPSTSIFVQCCCCRLCPRPDIMAALAT